MLLNARICPAICSAILALACAAAPGQATTLFKTLHAFTAASDAESPTGNIAFDGQGNMYGTCAWVGTSQGGLVWEVSADGIYSVLYTFVKTGGIYTLGDAPQGGVALDSAGNLYGTCSGEGADSGGTVWKLSGGTMSVLHSFEGTSGGGGESPFASVTLDSSGNLYGTCPGGGAHFDGVIWEPVYNAGSYVYKDLHDFAGCATDGSEPYAGVTIDSSGNLYGTTQYDGAHGSDPNGGVIWKMAKKFEL